MSGSRARTRSSQSQNQGNDGIHRRSKRIAETLKGSPSKFLKLEEVNGESELEENSPPSDTEQPILGNRHFFAKSEFTLALKDCWRLFFDRLENRKEVMTLRNASALFNDADVLLTTRKQSALWSLAVPILLDRGMLSHKRALASRVVNQEVKAAVDDALINSQPSWMTNAYIFSNVDDIQRFLEHFDRTARNPFISMQCDVRASDAATFERSMELLTHFGHYLHTLNFGMDNPEPWFILDRRLAQLLPLIPSVKSLRIGLRGFRPQDNPMWMIAMMYRRRMPVLPALHSLTSLEVYRLSHESWSPNGSLILHYSFCEPPPFGTITV